MICTRCNSIEGKRGLNKREKINTAFLLLFFFPLGILYLLFLKNKLNKCQRCGGSLIDESSPLGIKIVGGKYEK